MMIIEPTQTIHMQRDARRLREALHTMRDHLSAQIANLLAPQTQLHDRAGPVAQVHDGARQRLVQRAVGGAEARHAHGQAQCLAEDGAERDADVFSGVVVVNCAR